MLDSGWPQRILFKMLKFKINVMLLTALLKTFLGLRKHHSTQAIIPVVCQLLQISLCVEGH